MKKILALLLALCLFPASAALAESAPEALPEETLRPLQTMKPVPRLPAEYIVDAAQLLLFETPNVTITGEADFSLDGELFKHARAAVIRDGERSLLQLKLHTPALGDPFNKTAIDSGYIVVSDGFNVQAKEYFRDHEPMRKGTTAYPRTSVLRRSVRLDMLFRMAAQLAAGSEALFGKDAVTLSEGENGARVIRIVLDEENAPALLNTGLTLALEAFAERYFGVDYARLSTEYAGDIRNYMTIAQGIAYTTEFVSVDKADVTVTLDAADELQSIEGAAGLVLQTPVNAYHLDTVFRLDVSDRGESAVDPEKDIDRDLLP